MGSQNRKGTPATTSTTPSTPTTELCEGGNDTTRNTGRSDHQNALTRRSTQRAERVTAQGPGKKLQRDGMWHRGVKPSSRCPGLAPVARAVHRFLTSADIVLIAGGDPHPGLMAMQRSGVASILVQRAHKDVVLIGLSAGAMVLGALVLGPPTPVHGLGIVPAVFGMHESPGCPELSAGLMRLQQQRTGPPAAEDAEVPSSPFGLRPHSSYRLHLGAGDRYQSDWGQHPPPPCPMNALSHEHFCSDCICLGPN